MMSARGGLPISLSLFGACLTNTPQGPGMVQQIQQQCPSCGASGYNVKKQKERQVLEVNIERGMRNGEKIR